MKLFGSPSLGKIEIFMSVSLQTFYGVNANGNYDYGSNKCFFRYSCEKVR